MNKQMCSQDLSTAKQMAAPTTSPPTVPVISCDLNKIKGLSRHAYKGVLLLPDRA